MALVPAARGGSIFKDYHPVGYGDMNSQNWLLIPLLSIATWLGMTASGFGQQAVGSRSGINQPSNDSTSLIAQAFAWPTFEIRVCWIDGRQNVEPFKTIVFDTLETAIGPKSGRSRYRFINDGACDGRKVPRIKLALKDERPWSLVGWSSQYLQRPTRDPTLVVNTTFDCFDPLASKDCANPKAQDALGIESCKLENRWRSCIEFQVIHEFLHALGFLHEHLRGEYLTDAPDWCKSFVDADRTGELDAIRKHWASYGVETVGEYDPSSIMNYCNKNNYRTGGSMSATDVAGLQALDRLTQLRSN